MTAMTFDSDPARYGALLRLFRRVGIIAVVAALFLAVHHQLTDVKDLFLRLFSLVQSYALQRNQHCPTRKRLAPPKIAVPMSATSAMPCINGDDRGALRPR